MSKIYLMKCGHVANAHDPYGNPVCVICAGLSDLANIIERECRDNIGLEGRIAKCPECGATTESRWDLPFFKYRPNKESDEHYDGCYGWD